MKYLAKQSENGEYLTILNKHDVRVLLTVTTSLVMNLDKLDDETSKETVSNLHSTLLKIRFDIIKNEMLGEQGEELRKSLEKNGGLIRLWNLREF